MRRHPLIPPFIALLSLTACEDDPANTADPADVGVRADASLRDASPGPGPDLGRDAATVDPCAPDDLVERGVGGWQIEVSPGAGVWRVTPPHGGEAVMQSPQCAVAPARQATGAPFENRLFGAFEIELEGNLSEMTWAEAAPTVTVAGETIYSGGPATLRFEAAEHDSLRVRLEAPTADGVELRWACGEAEGFFGLGTQVVGPDLRGHAFPLWTQEQGINKGDNAGFPLGNTLEAAYAPMGVWHSSAGYAAVIDHDGYSELDLCVGAEDTVALRTFSDHTGFVLVPGETPRARMAGVTDWTGRPPAVPAWTFAPWNDAVGGPERLRAVATRLREAGVPSSAIWSEDWIGGEQSNAGYRLSYAWAWDPETYPDLPGDVAWLHGQGFAFLAYFNTFVPQPTAMYAEGIEGDYLVKDDAGEVITFQDPAFRPAALIDLTNAEARSWMMRYKRLAADSYGIDGWMADFSEWLPVEARMADGRDGWAAHNTYPLDYQRLNREAMEAVHEDPQDWLFFSRSGWASTSGGVSGLAPVLWAGDQNTDWDRDDGFPSVIPIGLNAGLAGVAYYGSDVAGYTSVRNPHTTKELFYRWASQGALTPVMRTHHGSDECANWSFDRDEETTAHFRRWASVHVLLYRYFVALAAEARSSGLPIMRHPILVEADEAQWREAQDQYFLGDDLLVAPVVEAGAIARQVHLPAPGWWPMMGEAPLARAAIGVEAPATEIPAFVRPGRALPLLPQVVDSFYGASAPEVTDLTDVGADTLLALYPDEAGAVRYESEAALLTAQGVTEAPDWSRATVDGAPISPCGAEAVAACYTADRLVLQPAGAVEVVAGDGFIRLDAAGGAWSLAYAGAAFGALAEPTPLTDLSPDIPPPCE